MASSNPAIAAAFAARPGRNPSNNPAPQRSGANNAVLVTLTPVLNFGQPYGPTTGNAQGSTDGITFALAGDSTYSPASGGQGGWQIIDRPREVAGLQWFDRSPMMIVASLIMDAEIINGSAGSPIEYTCQLLDSWQDKVPGTNMPPVFTVTGPVAGIQHQWVIYTLSFGAAIRNYPGGFRTQQKVDLTLYEYNSVLQQTLNTPGPAAQAAYLNAQQNNGAGGYYIYQVVQGDTLETIATRFLGNFAEWTNIAQLNNIRDPNNLIPGQPLLIPNN